MTPTSDLVIADATVVTVDATDRVLRQTGIAVRGGVIAALGPTETVAASHPDAERIDARGMVVLPGLVDGHIHAFTALYKGTMVGFGFERTMGEDTDFCMIGTPEEMYAASRLAALELLRGGVTLANVAGDSPTFAVARETARAFGEAGVKAFVQTMLGDRFGLIEPSADAQFAEAERLVRECHGSYEGRIRVAPSPAGEFTTSIALMRRLAALGRREHLVTHMHVFPRWPTGIVSWLLRGRSPLGLLRAGRLLDERLLAVHVLAATRGDIRVLARVGVSVVHCPSVWMNAGIGPGHWLSLRELRRAGVNVVLGTDSAGGWIEGADLFAEMRTAALVASFLYGADCVRPAQVLRMATINGARALGLGAETGSIEIGKQADLVLLRFDRPPVQPSSDVPAMIVYGASARDVDTVLVDGRVVVHGGRVLTLDEREVVAAAERARSELYRRGGWQLGADGATPPPTSWLERYPVERIARWGRRWARAQRLWKRAPAQP